MQNPTPSTYPLLQSVYLTKYQIDIKKLPISTSAENIRIKIKKANHL